MTILITVRWKVSVGIWVRYESHKRTDSSKSLVSLAGISHVLTNVFSNKNIGFVEGTSTIQTNMNKIYLKWVKYKPTSTKRVLSTSFTWVCVQGWASNLMEAAILTFDEVIYDSIIVSFSSLQNWLSDDCENHTCYGHALPGNVLSVILTNQATVLRQQKPRWRLACKLKLLLSCSVEIFGMRSPHINR